MFRQGGPWLRPALINGAAGVVVVPHGQLATVMAFTVVDARIVAIDTLNDPERLARIDLAVLDLPEGPADPDPTNPAGPADPADPADPAGPTA
jgi:RNA polymerase sigma-70 factor (ECF subfamily)